MELVRREEEVEPVRGPPFVEDELEEPPFVEELDELPEPLRDEELEELDDPPRAPPELPPFFIEPAMERMKSRAFSSEPVDGSLVAPPEGLQRMS